jgi:hypothetical protein
MVHDFGTLPMRSTGSGPFDVGGGGGGKVATFPVKTREGGVGVYVADEPWGARESGVSMETNTNAGERQPSSNTTQPPSLNTN